MAMEPKKLTCIFCDDEDNAYGGLLTTEDVTAHSFCVVLSETIKKHGENDQGILGFLKEDILKEKKAASYKRCHYCRKFGGNLGCAQKSCRKKFHLPCGINENAGLDFLYLTSYCRRHNKKSTVGGHSKNVIHEHVCIICMDTLTQNDYKNIIWADCCKTDVMLHPVCAQTYALHTGYYTKCPGCNDYTQFINTLKVHGIFVPHTDTSRERSDPEYADLFVKHSTCDVPNCKHLYGRTHSTPTGHWKLYLCDTCGSYGTHQLCSFVKREFVCPNCREFEKSVVNEVVETPEETFLQCFREFERCYGDGDSTGASTSKLVEEVNYAEIQPALKRGRSESLDAIPEPSAVGCSNYIKLNWKDGNHGAT